MSSIERDLNEYLFYEFGEEGDLSEDGDDLPSGLDDEDDLDERAELIDESESEAAPAAID